MLFHHAHGLTPGMVAFADELRRAGHTVHTPDLFEGRTFENVEEGVSHAREIGFGEVMERGVRAVERLPVELVYAGFSLGVLPAQSLAQTRAGARCAPRPCLLPGLGVRLRVARRGTGAGASDGRRSSLRRRRRGLPEGNRRCLVDHPGRVAQAPGQRRGLLVLR